MFSSQSHPPMVPPPPPPPPPAPVEISASRDAHQQPESSNRGGVVVVSPYRQNFPIRISQPQAHHRAMPSYNSFAFNSSAGHEYQLRRKTPNGTIDAGYDGSPTQLCPGPPPLKQMVLPTPSVANLFPRPSLQSSALELNRCLRKFEDGGYLNSNPSPWFPANGTASLDASFRHGLLATDQIGLSWQAGNHSLHGQIPNAYQPLMRAAEYNVRAFCPPPMPMAGSSAFGQLGWQSEPVMWEPQYLEPFAVPLPDLAVGRNSRYNFQVQQQPPGGAVNPVPDRDIAKSSNLNMQSLRLDTDSGNECHPNGNQAVVQRNFKEKALYHAHRHYVDLLSHLQSARRAGQADRDNRADASSKPIVYLKAPKFRSGGPCVVQHSGTGIGCQDFSPTASVPQVDGLPTGNGLMSKQRGHAGHAPIPMSTAYTGQLPLPNSSVIESLNPINGSAGFSGTSAAKVNAKASLEVLRSLCEQSKWGWCEGILLGGCLQYGLGHYDEALKWFSRVVALNSSHVEAITNMAATLYCLGRLDEAEQHWLRAVRMCPGHLDAAEQLVGLLYRKRNHDAIEIIAYVQQALKSPVGDATRRANPMPISEHKAGSVQNGSLDRAHPWLTDRPSPKTSDFGSSGYAIPDHENGRMLALVHAKGTLLYSLKDIWKASKAFEEAVLISVGQRIDSVQDLVRQIHAVLSIEASLQAPLASASGGSTPLRPLMLPPERARKTAHLLFSRNGALPGLCSVPEGPARRAAIQTTSNALLSLAKIYQDAISSGNTDIGLMSQSSGVGDILALYYLSLSLQESPSTANNVGILLAGVQQSVAGALNVSSSDTTQPNLPGIPAGSGLALALSYYNYGLRLDPKHVHLYTNLGSLLKDIGQLDLAIQMYERAVSCDGTFDIALTNLANAVKDKGRIKDAISYYKRAVIANPGFSEAVCGLFTALNSVCDWRGRGGVVLNHGSFDRWHVDENGALQDVRVSLCASGLTKRVVAIVRQQLDDASQWGAHLLRQSAIRKMLPHLQRFCSLGASDFDKALAAWTGRPWEGARLVRLLERATRVMQWTWYCDQYIRGKEVLPGQYPRARLPPSLSIPFAPTVLPFHTFTCPLPARDIRKISQSNAIRISCSTLRSSWLPSTVYPPPPPPHPHLNIGYVSSDFNNHPLAHLMQSVFGFHDPRRARAFCYATTPSDKSSHRQKIESEAPTFRDVSTWPPSKLADQIVADQIHILVNLNGYTRGARNEIFAARPAPIQMSFMGFAGTLGAEWCDYILADSTAIPPRTLRPARSNTAIDDLFSDQNEDDEPDWMYSENIIFCRQTFFCCDHAQSCGEGEREMTWESEQRRRWKMRKELFPNLSDDAIILGNFNQLYKIEPTTFRSWLRILARTPKAVLWLLRFPDLGESNLRHTAEMWAGTEVASRIIFTDVAPKNQHISRARVCDLFLDTPECNAHTTAADILWSSTPLLTLPRYPYKMCSRMAASILKGALPECPEGQRAARELIASSETEYEELAADLANGLHYLTGAGFGQGKGRLAEIRKLLWDSKWTCALFNTRRWVNDVQEAYEEAWRRWVHGQGGDIYL